jgi:hypothetical protein
MLTVGVREIVGVKLIVGEVVMDGVNESVGLGGKYLYIVGSPKILRNMENRNKKSAAISAPHPACSCFRCIL